MLRTGIDLTTQLSPFVPAPGPSAAEFAALEEWLPSRRWFPVKSGLERLEPWLSVTFADASDTVIHLLRAHGASGVAVVQVPVRRRPIPASHREARDQQVGTPPATPAGLIAELGDDWLLDAFLEESFWRSWLTVAQWGEADDGAPADLDLSGAVFISGEQSNSSVIFPRLAGGAILKVFRGLAQGPNPDVDVPRALVQAGWQGVPAPLAWLELSSAEHGTGLLDLGVLSQFIAGSSDGFELACAYAAEARSFADEATWLGQTVAQLHRVMAMALPTDQRVGLDWLRTELRHRARQAIANESVLTSRAPAIENLLNRLGHETDPAHDDVEEPLSLLLQHIHGDLHLGQALFAPDSGWHILDFEGEPMRPVAERLRPDLPVRDVAGMLRSFDYAAAVGETLDPQWTRDAREAFLTGYRGEAANGDGPNRVGRDSASRPPSAADPGDQVPPGAEADLLRALELDKALYELGYEAANRPDWVHIPLAGIDRILASLAEQ